MAQPVTIFRGTSGLNNRLDPVRIAADPETAIRPLAAALNVDIDDTGRVSRRKGYTKRFTGDVHSLWCDGGDCLFVSGTALYRFNHDYSATGLRSGLSGGARMSYVQVDDKVYYTNDYENGYVLQGGASYAWTAGTYVGPTTIRTYSSPPVGHLLEHYNGRIYIASGKILWYTEPLAYSWVDFHRNYTPFASRLQMVRGVRDGLYVSDETNTYFLWGDDPQKDMRRIRVANYPAIRGTDRMIPGSMLGGGEISGRIAMWASPEGICMGGPEGTFRNLTERNLNYPPSLFGASLYKEGKFIVTLEP